MTSKIATVANLAYQVFSHCSKSNLGTVSSSLCKSNNSSSTELNNLQATLSGNGNNESLMECEHLHEPINKLLNACQDQLPAEHLQKLLETLASVTPADVDFDTNLLSDTASVRYHAPVIYVHIVENEIFSMGIFVLRPGARIPLHDHPGMYGLCKVLLGSVRARSYHSVQRPPAADITSRVRGWQRASLSAELVQVQLASNSVLTPDSLPTLLTPFDYNFHEIQALGGGAAFLDILAPPYDHDLGTRVCRYYREVIFPPVGNTVDGGLSSEHVAAAVAAAAQLPRPLSPMCSVDGSIVNNELVPLKRPGSAPPFGCHEDCPVSTAPSSSFVSSPPLFQVQLRCDLLPSLAQFSPAKTDTLYLLETPEPPDFVCISTEYTGPKVT